MTPETQIDRPEESLEELYENAPCGYLSTLPDGQIVRVNQTFLNQTGYDRTELLGGCRFHDLMTVPGRVFYTTHFAPLIRVQGFAREIACDLMRSDKGKMAVLINAVQVLNSDGKPAFIRFTVFDATERRRYEADLVQARRNAEHFMAIVQASADAILSMAVDGTVLTWNKGSEIMFGYAAAEAIGKKAWKVINVPDGASQLDGILTELRLGSSFERLIEFVNRNGEKHDAWVTLTPHIEPPDEMTSISAIVRDVTERKRANIARQREDLLQNIVKTQEAERHRIARDLHDHLGQQLTGLRLMLTELKGKCGESDLGSLVGKIQEMALQIDRDMSFLAFELRPDILDRSGLSEAIAIFVREWTHNFGIKADFHTFEKFPERLALDIETNLYRIVQESLNNTLKHARASKVNVTLKNNNGEIVLIVEDDGIGFAPDLTTQTSKKAGHGLGLQGMRERAVIIGGSLEIESTPTQGTAILVRVPIS